MCSKSLISEEILKFYCQNLNACVEDGRKYVNEDYTLEFNKIYDNLLRRIFKESKELSYDEYLLCFDVLKPVFQASQTIVNEIDTKTLKLDWIRINMYHDVCMKGLKEIVLTENVEKILLLTAMLDYALGSIYYTLSEKTTPPHLLRDLLGTSELRQIFGHEAITFLRILLGTPKSINLRNIVWHGFPKPSDIPSYYVSILLLTVHTFGHVLEQSAFKIIYRPQMEDFQQYITGISQDLLSILPITTDDLESTIENTKLIAKDYKVYWTRLFQLYRDQKYWNFVSLILPQIELILRLKYSEVNDFDVSAKLDEYYITMDTIFEPVLPYKSVDQNFNRLISGKSALNESTLKLLYDVFIAPNGPRLRDKVSHGEVTIDSINSQKLCQILLYLSLCLLAEDHKGFSIVFYESKFHLNCRTKLSFNKAIKALEKFAEFHKQIGSLAQRETSEPAWISIRIFQRPKKESVYVLLLLKAANLIIKTCENYVDSIGSCQAQLIQRELRSRRRRTLMALLDALPNVYDCLCSILNCLLETFKSLQAMESDSEIEDNDRLLKFLRRTLKITENFVKYSSLESNEWIKAVELCEAFHEIRKKLFHVEKNS